MKGSEFAATLPIAATPEGLQQRETMILNALPSAVYELVPIPLQRGSLRATIHVMQKPLAIGELGDAWIVGATATLTQKIADRLGMLLPTTRLADEIHRTALANGEAFEPCLQTASPHMGETPALTRNSLAVQEKAAHVTGPASAACKHWVLSNKLLTLKLGTVCNYGYYSKSAPYVSSSGLKMWQTLGTAHNDKHVDYSQSVQLVGDTLVLHEAAGDREVPIRTVGEEPALCGLISDEGVVKAWRLPSVPLPGQPIEVAPGPPALRPIPLYYSRDLYRGIQGRNLDVIDWQFFLHIGADGIFGRQTEAATKQFQVTHGLAATGVVDRATVDAANGVVEVHKTITAPVDRFIQARNYTRGPRRGPVTLIVLHTMEASEKGTTAEAVAGWFAGPQAPQASAHYCIDNDSIVQCVKDDDIAWHAPGANANGIGLEHAGYARQTPEEWEDEFSKAMLLKSAGLTAFLLDKFGLPAVFCDAARLIQGDARGITTHYQVTMAFKKSTHTDPGRGFPMQKYLELVAAA